MKKLTCLFFFSFLIFGVGFGQMNVADSLLVVKEVDSLLTVSRELTNQRKFEEAIQINSIARKLILEKIGKETRSYGDCCYNMGRTTYRKGDFNEAEKWHLEGLNIREKVLTRIHFDVAISLGDLSILYTKQGKFDKAEPLISESVEIYKKLYKNKTFNYTVMLTRLANLYSQTNRFEEAAPLYYEVIEVRRNDIGVNNPDYAWALINLGNNYFFLGQIEKSIELFSEALKIQEATIGREHPDYVSTLNNLGNVYSEIGNFSEAIKIIGVALEVRKKVLGEKSLEYASSLIDLGSNYTNIRSFEKAEGLIGEGCEILKEKLGLNHPDVAYGYNQLAVLNMERRQYNLAISQLQVALGIHEQVLGKKSHGYLGVLTNIINYYYQTSQIKIADSLAQNLYNNRQSILGKNNLDYLNTVFDLAKIKIKSKQFDLAQSLIVEGLDLTAQQILKLCAYLNEKDLGVFVQTLSSGNNMALTLSQDSHESGKALWKMCFKNVLFYKGFLLASATHTKKLAQKDPKTTEQLNQLKSYHRRLAQQYAQPIAERDSITVAQLEEKANQLEKELVRTVAGFGDAIRQVNWQEVQKQLKPDEAAIEFVHFNYTNPDPTDSTMYAALVLRPGWESPKFVPLFEEKQLQNLLLQNTKDKTEQVKNLYAFSENGLAKLIFKSLEPEIEGVKTIYFSPSGLLHRINLGAIAVSRTENWGERFHLVQLGSTRQLVVPQQIAEPKNTAVLFGGIRYDLDTTAIFSANASLGAVENLNRGDLNFSQSDSTLRGEGEWLFLNNTEKEVAEIAPILQDNSIQTTVQKGFAASEEAFKSIGKNGASPKILHLATHGYFFPDVKNEKVRSESQSVFKISDHPMIRSGLILAGGNQAWKTGKPIKPTVEDGILTAYEVSQMNLANTELVVLSACETGLGDIAGNEGVYGLQRAFKIAGAKYLLMSLWQVPDFHTQVLMKIFYKNYLDKKMSISDAFRDAQNQLRKRYENPFFWAGFVLVE